MADQLPDRWSAEIVRVAGSLAFDQEDAAWHFRRLSEGAAPDSEAWVVQTVLDHAGVDRLRAENERLRKALSVIAEGRWNVGASRDLAVRDFARLALASEEETR